MALLVFIIGFFAWPYMGRIIRGQTLSLREREFVDAARSLGARGPYIMFRELLPNLVGPILVYSTLLIPTNILFEAALDYLGVGLIPPTPSWGQMLSNAVSQGFFSVNPMYMIIPGVAIFITVMAFNLFGDGLRDALDPRSSNPGACPRQEQMNKEALHPMSRYRTTGLAAVGAVVALVAAACGGSSGGGTQPRPRPRRRPGSTRPSLGGQPVHPQGRHDRLRQQQRPGLHRCRQHLLRVQPELHQAVRHPADHVQVVPGACGTGLVPGLATTLGVASNGNKTWTYHLKSGVKFEDGTPVTSADVKYAVERTFDRAVLPNGPSYFASLLAGNAASYKGPFKDKTGNLTAIATPNSTTIVFHLNQPFADFNYVVAFPQTAPVPPSKDTGANYQLHPLSTGPYKFQSYQLNKQYMLVPNPKWNPSWNPQVKQLASKIIVNLA